MGLVLGGRLLILVALALALGTPSPTFGKVGANALRGDGAQAQRSDPDREVHVLHPTRDVSLGIDDSSPETPVVDSVNDPAHHSLFVSNHDVQPRDHVALLAFDLPQGLDDLHLVHAELRLFASDVTLRDDQPTRTLWVAGNGEPWDAATLDGQPVPPACCGTVPWNEPRREPGWIAWNVAALVGAWFEGGPNHGLRVTPSGHLLSDHYYYTFWSAEGQMPPELVLTFRSAASSLTAYLPMALARSATLRHASDP